MTNSIDLNADMGESFGAWQMGDDAAMLDIVTSANIACGMHGGDPLTMVRTVAMAKAKGVGIGAHPGFDDLRGFGRRRFPGMTTTQLEALILYQLGALAGVACAEATTLAHVKIHGALNNMMAEDVDLARIGAQTVRIFDPDLIWVGQAATPLAAEAQAVGLRVAPEIFADRAYTPEGLLMPRSEPGAVIHDPHQAAEHVLKLIEAYNPATICVHGDTPGAVRLAENVRKRLEAEGLRLQPMGATGSNLLGRS